MMKCETLIFGGSSSSLRSPNRGRHRFKNETQVSQFQYACFCTVSNTVQLVIDACGQVDPATV